MLISLTHKTQKFKPDSYRGCTLLIPCMCNVQGIMVTLLLLLFRFFFWYLRGIFASADIGYFLVYHLLALKLLFCVLNIICIYINVALSVASACPGWSWLLSPYCCSTLFHFFTISHFHFCAFPFRYVLCGTFGAFVVVFHYPFRLALPQLQSDRCS